MMLSWFSDGVTNSNLTSSLYPNGPAIIFSLLQYLGETAHLTRHLLIQGFTGENLGENAKNYSLRLIYAQVLQLLKHIFSYILAVSVVSVPQKLKTFWVHICHKRMSFRMAGPTKHTFFQPFF